MRAWKSVCGGEVYLNWLNIDDPNWMQSQLFGKRVVDIVFVAGLIVCWLKILWFGATKFLQGRMEIMSQE